MSQHMIGVAATGEIAVAVVRDNQLASSVRIYPEREQLDTRPDDGGVHTMPMASIVSTIAGMIQSLCREHDIVPAGVGIGLPGIIRNGIIEDSPNLKQGKGTRLAELMSGALAAYGLSVPVSIYNDGDVTATGLAATKGHLEKLVRVWTIGQGIGFGCYPLTPGIWEGGHMTVSLDPKETYCGCGGKGHLEGIMGHRAMRLRFLDLEPEEIFENACRNDPRCAEFVTLWHRALAAATASVIHLGGSGKFFLTGFNARFVQINLLNQYLHEMVTLSPLQGSVFEVVPTSTEIAIIGAAVNASMGA